MFGFLRFFLATNVVLTHIVHIRSLGPFAVYTFFILSGFLMTTIMKNTYNYTIKGIMRYAINRFLKLFPVHWFLLLLTIAIIFITSPEFAYEFNEKIKIPSSASEILANITMIYPAFHPGSYPSILAASSWALTIEIFFYFLIGLGLSRNRIITLCWFFMSILYMFYLNINSIYGLGYGNVLTASLPFSLGAVLFYYKTLIIDLLRKIPGNITIVISIIFTLNLIFTSSSYHWLPEIAWKIAIIGSGLNLILSSLLIIVLWFEGKNHFSKPVDIFYGDLSYPIYLFHMSAGCFISWVIYDRPVTELSTEGLITFVGALVATIIASIITTKLISNPIEKIRTAVKKI